MRLLRSVCYRVFGLPLLLIALVLIGLLFGQEASAQDRSLASGPSSFDNETSFDDLFAHVRSITVEGSEEYPIFQTSRLAVQDGLLAVIDQSSHTLTVLRDTGDILYQVGGEGEGPGDLTQPDWVGFDALGRIVVREWFGNNRVQIFSAEDGRSLDVFSLEHGGLATGQGYIEGAEDNQRLIFSTGVPCAEDENRLCVVQEQAFSGEVIRRFGPMDEIEPGYKGMPFIMGRDVDGRSYLAHRSGGNVVVYDAEGNRTGHFRIDSAPDIQLLDMEALPDDLGDQLAARREADYTMIRSIYPVGNHIIIDHYRDYESPNYFLTIWTPDGELLESGIGVVHPIIRVDGDRFFLLEEDLEVDYGSYVIHEYHYEGL